MSTFRKYFPFFQKTDVVWLDTGATAQKPSVLLETEHKTYEQLNANIHRGLYASSESITQKYEDTRASVARWINSRSEEVFFTSGTTAALNCIATYWGPAFVKKGDEIITTIAEHHANFLPWQRYAQQVGAILTVIPYDTEKKKLDLSSIKITNRTKIVAVSQYSNVLGPIWDEQADELSCFVQQVQSVGAFTVLDAAQSMPHQLLNVERLSVDAAVFSAHKVCGATGVGAVFLRKKWHDLLPPFFVGGGMVSSVSVTESSWLPAPHKFEAGTPAIVQVVSWGAVLDFLNEVITEDEKKAFRELVVYAIEHLMQIEGAQILGNLEWIKRSGSLISFQVAGLHGHDIAALLAQDNIAVRAGHHCAQPLHEALSVGSSVRMSLYYYNTKTDIDACIKSLKKAIQFLR